MPRVLNAFHLKVLMVVLMVLDHLYYNLFPDMLWWHILARAVAPVFCYLMTEGMIHTRNRPRYIVRIFVFAGLMLAGNLILYAIFGHFIRNSILLALGLGALVILCIEKARAAAGWQRALWIVAAVAAFAVSSVPLVEGSTTIPTMALLFFYLHDRPLAMTLCYLGFFGLPYLFIIPVAGLATQFWMVLAIIPILLYNGQRGPGGRLSKYFFYIFYPVHIWIIFLIEELLQVGH